MDINTIFRRFSSAEKNGSQLELLAVCECHRLAAKAVRGLINRRSRKPVDAVLRRMAEVESTTHQLSDADSVGMSARDMLLSETLGLGEGGTGGSGSVAARRRAGSFTAVAVGRHALKDDDVEDPDSIPLETLLPIIGSTFKADSYEAKRFRETMIRIHRISEEEQARVGTENSEEFDMPVYLNHEPLPSSVTPKFLVKVSFLDEAQAKTIVCQLDDTPNQILELLVPKFNRTATRRALTEDFVFKVSGLAEFIFGDFPLRSFEYIRKCLIEKSTVDLSLVKKSTFSRKGEASRFRVRYDLDTRQMIDHTSLDVEGRSFKELTTFSLWNIDRPFRMKVVGVENLVRASQNLKSFGKSLDELSIYVLAELHHGNHNIGEPKMSRAITASENPRFNEWITFDDLLLSHLSKETRLCFTLFARLYRKDDRNLVSGGTAAGIQSKDKPLGWVNFQLIDHMGELRTGRYSMRLWPDERAIPRVTCVENVGDPDAATLFFEFEEYSVPVVFPSGVPLTDPMEEIETPRQPSPAELERTLELSRKDPLYRFTEDERRLLWLNRRHITGESKGLAKFLASVPWQSPTKTHEAHELLQWWSPLSAIEALELLDGGQADEVVRQYAVGRLDSLDDAELYDLMLQLTQVLKFEAHHDSALARYLLKRAVQSPHLIGHVFYWYLKAEMHVAHVCERNGLLLEEFLRMSGSFREDFRTQNYVVQELTRVAYVIKRTPKKEVQQALHRELSNLELPSHFKLALSPRLESSGIVVDKCKVMDSKKQPLWLTFKNADPVGDSMKIIFKAGDDPRQDMLTLQMLRIMDKLWKKEGVDLHLIPYGCIVLGDAIGMIEVVLNSETTATITKEAGGATAAFREDPIAKWLRRQNPRADQYKRAVDLFIASCAGYCVATYVMGIGDRHNDNIMLTKSGQLFHIDFGHFLGNYKTFAGWKRETAPFVFTPDYCYVMGGTSDDRFRTFCQLCCRAYNILRRHGDMFINLFKLMISTGIPELQKEEDIDWLRDRLMLGSSDEEAARHFEKQIHVSLKTKRTQINNFIHIMAHK